MSSQLPSSPDGLDLGHTLSAWLLHTTFPPEGTPLRCGVSGGADSLALMALATAAGCVVTAVHVDHGQRDGSADEADVVHAYAQSIGAGVERHRADIDPGSNLEARMRAARYGVLGPHAATGHTVDDQAETMLINLVRGSGLVGLGAMEPGHRRPILGLRRADTEAVCAALGWQPVTDASNDDPAFQRNRMRHEVMPLLDDIAGRDVAPLLARSTAHARDAARVVADHAAQLDPTDALALAAAPRPVAAMALQQWVRSETGDAHPIDTASVQRLFEVIDGDVKAAEVSGGWRVSRSQQRLRISGGPTRESGSLT